MEKKPIIISKINTRGQSFVELILAFPIVLLLLAGLVEIGFILFSYLNLLDLTREAARFASLRDYRAGRVSGLSDPLQACSDNTLDYFYDTACFFIDPDLNPYAPFNAGDFDDVAITVFTVSDNTVTNRWPNDADGVWSLFSDNWKKNCDGTPIPGVQPFFTNAKIQSLFVTNAPDDRGLVLVEAYYCHDLIMNLPLISLVIPSPFRIHAYTIMPAPEALPTPTPIP